jgi:hypothetical protein
MFQVIMRLEKSVSREEFHKDTPDREHVAREAPSEACQGRSKCDQNACSSGVLDLEEKRPTENDLGRSIMACADDRRMELVVESRAPKVDQSDIYVSQDVLLFGSLYLESPGQSFSA